MNIFLCHSGDQSLRVAKALHDFLPRVLQRAKPFISDDGIAKGDAWMNALGQRLEDSSIGIICLTPDNLIAPWIHFEVGALFKASGTLYVCTYLFGVRKADVVMPLSFFQGTEATKEDTLKLIQTINDSDQADGISEKVLTETFEQWWPTLEKQLEEIPSEPTAQPTVKRDQSEILEEVLLAVRRLERNATKNRAPEKDIKTITSLRDYLLSDAVIEESFKKAGLGLAGLVTQPKRNIRSVGQDEEET